MVLDKEGRATLVAWLLGYSALNALRSNDLGTAKKLLGEMEWSLSSLKPGDAFFYHHLRTLESLAGGDLKEAALHAELALKFSTDVGTPSGLGLSKLARAHVMHALGENREAAEALSEALGIARQIRSKSSEYYGLMADALFALDRGEEATCLEILRRALAIGKESECFTTYIPPPSAMVRLCERALEAGIEVDYVQDLIRKHNLIPEKPPFHIENWPWPLKIYTLGHFELVRDGQPIQFSRKIQQKPLSLLKVLIALGGREVKEEQIADILWPEAEGDAAHHAFVSALHRLRQLVGYEKALALREGKLTMDNRYFWVDAWALEYIWRQAEAQRKEGQIGMNVQMSEKTIEMYRGSFLGGESEEPWMVSLRERLRSKYLSCVNRLGQHWLQLGNGEKAIECYQRGLDVDDLAEEFYQGLMLCYQRLNRETEARAVYHRCRKTLSSALGIEPSAKTEAIYESIMKKVIVPGQMARTSQKLN